MTAQNRNIRVVFVVTVCFVFVLSIFSYTKINSLIKSAALVNHTTQVTLDLEKVIGSLKDAETGHRGYLLTHDSVFLATFDQGLKQYTANISGIHKLVDDNPLQQKSIETIELLAKHREAHMRKMLKIDSSRTPTAPELLAGKFIMDSLRAEIDAMIARENNLMGSRTEDLYKQKVIVPAMLLILSVVSLLVLFICYWLLNRSLIEAQKLKNRNFKLLVETEKQKQIQHIFKNAPVSIIIFKGKNFIVESINDVGLEMWGKTHEEIINKPCFDVIPELRKFSEPVYKKILETGEEIITNEAKLEFTRNGKPYSGYFNLMRQPLRNMNGVIEGIISISIEVTESVLARKAIEESEKRFHNLIYSSPSAIGMLEGEDLVITSANEAIIIIWGKGKEIIGQKYFEALPELAEQGYKEVFAAVYQTGIPFNAVETPVRIIQNGETTLKYYNFLLYAQRNINNEIYGIGIIATEVTSQAVLNNQVKESEARFRKLSESLEEMVMERTRALEQKNIELEKTNRELSIQKEFSETILNTTPDLISAYDTEMRIIAFNKSCEDSLNLKKEDVLGKKYVAVFPDGKDSQGHQDLIRALNGETIHNDVYKSQTTGRYYENFIKPLKDSSGSLYAAVAIAHDITEVILSNEKIKKANEELNESTERFLKIFDSNPIPMTLTEIKTNKIRYANKLFYASFGYTQEEVIGRTSAELNLVEPEESQRVTEILFSYLQESRTLAEIQALSLEETEELLTRLKQTDVLKNLEILYTRKNGEKFPAELSFEILRFGSERYTITSYQDVTERKEAREQLTLQNENLVKANKELESFNYISSHDLQEPLRQIQNFASRITSDEQQNLSEKGKTYFEKMNSAANRMQTLIADLLAYSRTKTSERKFEITNLNAIVEDVTSELKEIIDEKDATVEVTELIDAKVIPFQFRQMMHNLIGNALKFSKPGTKPHIRIKNRNVKSSEVTEVSLAPDREYCHISISDNGIGFEPHYKDRIFEVFQRLHDKQKIAGTGIGLAIVKKIVENHDGFISATGEPDLGATFNIYIPASQTP